MRVLFLCGDQSRYGLAHLAPVLQYFEVAAVAIATPRRWAIFRDSLQGKSYTPPPFSTVLANAVRRVPAKLRKWTQGDSVRARVTSAGVPLICVDDVNASAWLEAVRRLAPDLILSAAYPQIFGRELLSIPRQGAINFHPSLLPRYRGAHPHFWAIATGACEGGVTAHYMTEQLDQGDIVAQISFPIRDLYYSQYYAKIEAATPRLVEAVRAFVDDPTRVPVPQDPSTASFFRNDREIHRRIFWTTTSAKRIVDLVRTEAAFCFLGRARVRPTRAVVSPTNRNLTNQIAVEPGTIVDVTSSAVIVEAIDGFVEVQSVRDGIRVFSGSEWMRHRRVRVGEKLT